MNLEDVQDRESIPSEPSVATLDCATGNSNQSNADEGQQQGGDGVEVQIEGEDLPPRCNSQGASNFTKMGPLHQHHMVDALIIAKKKELDEKWASFFYEANVPFTVARHLAFIEAMKATSLACFEHSLPLYHQFKSNLIEPKKLQIENEIIWKTTFAVKNYGVTICTNGWDDVN